MKLKFKQVGIKFATWLVFELLLNSSGLDDLADYSEFVFDRHMQVVNSRTAVVLIYHFPLLSG